jgi:hypothetical protein
MQSAFINGGREKNFTLFSSVILESGDISIPGSNVKWFLILSHLGTSNSESFRIPSRDI